MKFEVLADYSITKTIGTFEAESEEEAIEQARGKIQEIGNDIGIYCADSVWAEKQGE